MHPNDSNITMAVEQIIKQVKDFVGAPIVNDILDIGGIRVARFMGEFWTSRQRQGNSLHEISYRACFKSELPKFFIGSLTTEGDVVYDPFAGRGTTAIEAALLGRKVISNDINPLSRILAYPRLSPPDLLELIERLEKINHSVRKIKTDINLSMFYHPRTLEEILKIKKYLEKRKSENREDDLDMWIRMVATNRLSGHSTGFFSVYTLPPNQALRPEKQKIINRERNQEPSYRNVKKIIIKKTQSLISEINNELFRKLKHIKETASFLTKDSRYTSEISNNSVQLTVTSPPFLDIVQYTEDNWLRCWFNSIDPFEVEKNITVTNKLEKWKEVIGETLKELYRITKPGGFVAFEVGEVRKGKIKLDEEVVPLGLEADFKCLGILVNKQNFTKTSNIWGISNNKMGTNTNRIVLFTKQK
ncbi:MAG: DNA adenine methylase [Candidatus Liptonbacteria bacterium]|nr:DNA adenine methylase [Candidatus Liptonbacteria bacterium]